MAPTTERETPTQDRVTVERPSDHELVVSRLIHGSARAVYDAWTRPELFKRWWVPKAAPMTLVACDLDVRVGGGYRLEFTFDGTTTMTFFGRYLEVEPAARLSWTNEESEAEVITTVTFREQAGGTLVVVHDRYPSAEALEAAVASGSTEGMPDQLDQLDELIASLAPTA